MLNLLNHTSALDFGIIADTGEGDDALAAYVAKMAELRHSRPTWEVTDGDPEALPHDRAPAREAAGSYENDVMALTVAAAPAGLRLEVRMKPEICAADTELAPKITRRSISACCPVTRASHHQRRFLGQRGFFTRNVGGAVVGVDLAGRLFNLVPAAPSNAQYPVSTGRDLKHCAAVPSSPLSPATTAQQQRPAWMLS